MPRRPDEHTWAVWWQTATIGGPPSTYKPDENSLKAIEEHLQKTFNKQNAQQRSQQPQNTSGGAERGDGAAAGNEDGEGGSSFLPPKVSTSHRWPIPDYENFRSVNRFKAFKGTKREMVPAPFATSGEFATPASEYQEHYHATEKHALNKLLIDRQLRQLRLERRAERRQQRENSKHNKWIQAQILEDDLSTESDDNHDDEIQKLATKAKQTNGPRNLTSQQPPSLSQQFAQTQNQSTKGQPQSPILVNRRRGPEANELAAHLAMREAQSIGKLTPRSKRNVAAQHEALRRKAKHTAIPLPMGDLKERILATPDPPPLPSSGLTMIVPATARGRLGEGVGDREGVKIVGFFANSQKANEQTAKFQPRPPPRPFTPRESTQPAQQNVPQTARSVDRAVGAGEINFWESGARKKASGGAAATQNFLAAPFVQSPVVSNIQVRHPVKRSVVGCGARGAQCD